MIMIEHTHVAGFEPAIRGMRNSWDSWEKSDSGYCQGRSKHCDGCWLKPDDDYAPCYFGSDAKGKQYVIGPNDRELMKKLIKGGSEHRKFLRMIVVWCDIDAPLYWWKQFDTYKVGTVANSCSTMHTITKKPFDISDFSCEAGNAKTLSDFGSVIDILNGYRDLYLETKDEAWWETIIQLLPESYNQKRTVCLNYEVLYNIYHQRKGHKLEEWHEFCKFIENLPYIEEFLKKE